MMVITDGAVSVIHDDLVTVMTIAGGEVVVETLNIKTMEPLCEMTMEIPK